MRTIKLLSLPCALALLLAGCLSPTEDNRSESWSVQEYGSSVEGRPLFAYVAGSGPDVTLILASIHGNESVGTPLLMELMPRLEERVPLDGRQVVLILEANPDGLVQGRRHNVHGVDLNRNFPAANFKKSARHGPSALSEPESRALHELLTRFSPDRVVSIHQPLSRIDYDGPAVALANSMAQWTDLPVKRIGSRPGSMGSYVGLTLELPIITLELPRAADKLDREALWSEYGDMLLQAIVHPQVLTRAPGQPASGE